MILVIQAWWYKPVIPATPEAEAQEWQVPGKVSETLSQKQTTKGLEIWLKALGSILSTTRKKISSSHLSNQKEFYFTKLSTVTPVSSSTLGQDAASFEGETVQLSSPPAPSALPLLVCVLEF
jgi:hypothetical protein